jgi:hypothetical protein
MANGYRQRENGKGIEMKIFDEPKDYIMLDLGMYLAQKCADLQREQEREERNNAYIEWIKNKIDETRQTIIRYERTGRL